MSEQPRVLFCCFDVVPGPHAQSRRLTEYIKGLGDRFQVVVLSVKADNSHIQKYHGARLLRVPVGNGDLPARVQAFDRAVRRQLESEEYVLVHFFDPFGGYALSEKRAELGYRVVYDAATFPSVEVPLESHEVESNRKFIARMRRQELFCLMNADAVIVGSEIGKNYVVGLGVTETNVSIWRAPVDLEPFTPEVMGPPDGKPMRLLHLGSENPWTGLATLVQAMGQVPDTSVHLTVVGPKHPAEHPKLLDKVTALKLEKAIDFQEPVAHEDIHKVLATADVGLVTMSEVERNRAPGGPLARLGEYMAAGRPVIAADLPLTRELVPADAALFYKPGDATALADAINTLAQEPARRVAMGAAARRASPAWDAAACRGALLDLYAKLAGPVAAPATDESTKIPSGIGQINDAVTQLGERPFAHDDSAPAASDPATNKVKTDPAIGLADQVTDPTAAGGRPPVMGTPLREESPVVSGEMIAPTQEHSVEMAASAVTDIESKSDRIVMGSPVRDETLPATTAPPAVPVSQFHAPTHASSAHPGSGWIAAAQSAARGAGSPLAGAALPHAVADAPPSTSSGEPKPPWQSSPSQSAAPVGDEPSPALPPRARDPRATRSPASAGPPVLFPTPSGGVASVNRAEAPASLGSPPFELDTSVPPLEEPPARTESVSSVIVDAALLNAPPEPVSSSESGRRQAPAGWHADPNGPPRLLPVAAPAASGLTDEEIRRAKSAQAAAPRPYSSGLTDEELRRAKAEQSHELSGATRPLTSSNSSAARHADPNGPPRLFPTTPPPAKPGTATSSVSGLRVGPPPLPISGPSGLQPPTLPSRSSGSGVVPRSTGSSAFAPPPPSGPRPYVGSASPPPLPKKPAARPSLRDEIVEVGNDEVMEISDDVATVEANHDEVMESDHPGVQHTPAEVLLPPSALDPWFAQLVHGYCPPESDLFARHVPPTTMPGRD